MKLFLRELLLFGIKQAYACLFGAILLFFILATHFYYPLEAILRYDFLFGVAILTQALFLLFRFETVADLRGALLFYIAGTIMEIFKVHFGAWIYPEAGMLKLFGVPLFSGFMYSEIGGYISRSWKIFRFSYTEFPKMKLLFLLSALIYINFFTHHFLPDIRLFLFGFAFFLFRKSWISFTIDKIPRKIPMILAAFLPAFFIWIAENIGAFSYTWIYPNQYHIWEMVAFQKLGSWFLLIILSFALVCSLHKPKDASGKTFS